MFCENAMIRTHYGMVGESAPMLDIYRKLERIILSDLPVYISGESGTGKELIATALHRESERGGRFVPLNCSAIPRELIESELFGCEKGAYTGAIRDRKGKFEEAGEGTLFFDEIGYMSMDAQPKLLRVLEDKKYYPVGSGKEVIATARIVSASYQNIADLMEQGKFDKALFYRLAVLDIALPSLRERGSDSELLVEYFLDENNQKAKKQKTFDQNAKEKLLSHTWPGNVRELRNVLDRAYVLSGEDPIISGDYIDLKRNPVEVRGNGALLESQGDGTIIEVSLNSGRTRKEILEGVDRVLLEYALERSNNVKAAAIRSLGMSDKTFHNKLAKYGIIVKAKRYVDDAQEVAPANRLDRPAPDPRPHPEGHVV